MNQPIRVMQVVGRMMGGGVEATVMNHYRHIDRSRVQFDFVVQSDSTLVPKEEIESLGGRVFVVPPYSNPIAYTNACRRIFQENKPLIVHSHMNAISVFTLRAAKQAGVPVRIAHSHSTSNPNERTKTLVKNILKPFSKLYPTHYAACGDYSARWLFGNAFVDSGRVHIVRNAIDLESFSFSEQNRARLRSEIGADDSIIVIGQVGRFCAQKNQLFSLDVMSKLVEKNKRSLLVMLGDGDDFELIRGRVEELGIESNVRLLGIRNDVNAWYSAFDVLLFPSLYEGLPLTAIEAQEAVLPIVASDCITSEAFPVKDLCTVLSLSNDWDDWTTTILHSAQLIDESERQMKETAFTLIESGYDIRQSADKLARWYVELAEKTPRECHEFR